MTLFGRRGSKKKEEIGERFGIGILSHGNQGNQGEEEEKEKKTHAQGNGTKGHASSTGLAGNYYYYYYHSSTFPL